MVTLSLVALFGYLGPAYARPPAFAANAAVPNPVNAHFGPLATLRGYELSTTRMQPGDSLDVTLYWHVDDRPPGNYLLFMHLVDAAGTMVAQRDTHPGTGNFPTGQWQAGESFVDTVRLYLPPTAYTPVTATLSMGLYAPTYRLPVTGANGESRGDSLALDTLQLLPANDLYPGAATFPNPLDQNFAEKVRLAGYEYDERVRRPGETVEVTLYWQMLDAALAPQQVSVQLMDEAGNVRATVQEPLPVTTAGNVVESRHRVPLAAELAPGTYYFNVALLDAATQERQNIVAADGHWIDNQLSLARIRVEP
jgi:hypothetical protein